MQSMRANKSLIFCKLVPKYTRVTSINMQQRFAVSFPKPLLEELDRIRGDIPRSKYLRRLVEKRIEK